ncbi:MAG TPA: hypothetical protein IAC50_05980 [Candidatus Copromorpha excrementigallinarum]|uniref:HTH luxR-type domain-containing protein n=1 Tax=Candidatus Allocopromorpha excrementigallinarum TaxID=2840742 RepID=A0A9D1I327_9FIRM|nr:hypothetical protein [Candidatus Copromorpha excrementigallinarum]
MSFTENEWYLINSIILDIYSASDKDSMRKRFLERIGFLIPYDKANFFLSDRDGDHYISNSVDVGFDPQYLENYFGNLEKFDFTNWIYESAQNEVFLLTELLSFNERERDVYIQNYFRANGMEYAVISSLSHKGLHVGTMTLFRSKKSGDFTFRDKQALSLLKNHLALYLYNHSDAVTPFDPASHRRLSGIAGRYRLTPRETEILNMLLAGDDIPAICQSLFISKNTLRKHISNIYKKFGVNRRSDLNKILYEGK